MKTKRTKKTAATRDYLIAIDRIIHWAKRAERAREQIRRQAAQNEGQQKGGKKC
tara:strand:- start:1439 stop:1600 length:162 start_codon:yes stop_codon:yes gene_type:complete